MLSRRGKMIIGLLAACVLLALGVSWYRAHQRDLAELAQARIMLQDHDAEARYYAAGVILKHEPGHIEARLIHARENFRRGRYLISRNDIQAIPSTATTEQAYEAAIIGAHSLLNIARNNIRQAPDRGVDTIGSQLTELLAQVSSYEEIIAADGRDPMASIIIKALIADSRAMYLRLVLRDIRAQIDQTRAASKGQTVEALGVQISDDQLELNLLEQAVGDLSQQAIRMDPLAEYPRVLLFKRYLRMGELALARESVQMLTRRDEISTELAIEVAGELLNLESRYHMQASAGDIALARTVLDRVTAQGRANVEYQFATAEVLLAQGHYQKADELLKQALSNRAYVGHLHGVCLRARALIGLGHAHEAEQMLAKVNDRKPSWESKFVQGLAMIAEGKSGLDLLRQAQEKQPDSLTVRLAICERIINNGGYEVADLDINQLNELAPMHPRVMQIRLDYAAHMGRRDIVNDYVHSVFREGLLKLTSDDVTLVGYMMLDDVAAAQRLSEKILAERPGNPVAMLGRHGRMCPADARMEAARYVAQALYPLVNDDPMRLPLPPVFTAWERRTQKRALAAFGEVDLQASGLLMRESLYLPWALETTLHMLTIASERWPEDQRLAQLAVRTALWLGRTEEARLWLTKLKENQQGPLEHAIAAYLADDGAQLEKLLASGHYVEAPAYEKNPDTIHVVNAANYSIVLDGYQGAEHAIGLSDHASATDPTWLLLEMLDRLKKRDLNIVGFQMENILKKHPRAHTAVLWVTRTLYESGEIPALDQLLNRIENKSPYLSQIARSRLLLATNQVAQSTQGISLVGVEALADSSIRWQQSEIEAIAALARDQPVLAIGLLETLGLSIRSESPAIGVGQVELMIDAGRDRAAGSIIMQQLSISDLPPVWTDAYLARAMYFMDAERVLRAVELNLQDRREDGVLLYYRARLLQKLGQDELARQAIVTLNTLRPDAPRVLMLQAQQAMDQARLNEARQILTKMITLGGESERIAQMYMIQLAGAQSSPQTNNGATP